MTPAFVILHTLAFKGTAGIDEVRRWHIERNFRDVGYHYLIRRDGRLETGRQEFEAGAHCKAGGMNHKSLGVAIEGHGDYEKLTDQQWVTLRVVYRFLFYKYSITPGNVLGHREVDPSKTCPGTKVDMNLIRTSLRHTLSNPTL